MANPRRTSSHNININNNNTNNNNSQNPERENPSSSSSSSLSLSLSLSYSISSILNLLKKPQAFPVLLTVFIILTWVSLRFHHPSVVQNPLTFSTTTNTNELDFKANLVRFKSSILAKDHRGWILDPISFALNARISGGAVSCASVHVGEFRPGSMRGNHRHYTCNETFILWGARIKFRLENSQVVDQGYAEVIIGEDEIAVAGSPSGTAHAMVNVDPVRTAYLLGCQDGIANYNSSGTAFNIWNDL